MFTFTIKLKAVCNEAISSSAYSVNVLMELRRKLKYKTKIMECALFVEIILLVKFCQQVVLMTFEIYRFEFKYFQNLFLPNTLPLKVYATLELIYLSAVSM